MFIQEFGDTELIYWRMFFLIRPGIGDNGDFGTWWVSFASPYVEAMEDEDWGIWDDGVNGDIGLGEIKIVLRYFLVPGF